MFCPNCGSDIKIPLLNEEYYNEDLYETPKRESAVNKLEYQQNDVFCEPIIDAEEKNLKSSKSNAKPMSVPYNEDEPSPGHSARRKVTKWTFFILAVVVLVLFFIAASGISFGSVNMSIIRERVGITPEENFYKCLGSIFAGFAMAIRGAGLFFAAILVYLGLRV